MRAARSVVGWPFVRVPVIAPELRVNVPAVHSTFMTPERARRHGAGGGSGLLAPAVR